MSSFEAWYADWINQGIWDALDALNGNEESKSDIAETLDALLITAARAKSALTYLRHTVKMLEQAERGMADYTPAETLTDVRGALDVLEGRRARALDEAPE